MRKTWFGGVFSMKYRCCTRFRQFPTFFKIWPFWPFWPFIAPEVNIQWFKIFNVTLGNTKLDRHYVSSNIGRENLIFLQMGISLNSDPFARIFAAPSLLNKSQVQVFAQMDHNKIGIVNSWTIGLISIPNSFKKGHKVDFFEIWFHEMKEGRALCSLTPKSTLTPDVSFSDYVELKHCTKWW